MLNQSLLEPFFEIVLSEHIGHYEGDSLFVLKNRHDYSWARSDDKQWGFLVTGFGSCSGCDAWEGAETGLQKFQLLAEEIEGIKWFPTLKELQDYVTDKYTADLQWYGHTAEYTAFSKTVSELTEGGEDQ